MTCCSVASELLITSAKKIIVTCCFLLRTGKCKKIEEGQECLQGMRLRQYHMLCGTLLRVWKRVSDVVSDITSSSILQIVRLKTKQHNKQVGQYAPDTPCRILEQCGAVAVGN